MSAACPQCSKPLDFGNVAVAERPELCPFCLAPLSPPVPRGAAAARSDFDDDSRYGGNKRLEPYRGPQPPSISGPEDFPSCISMRPVEESAVGALGEFGHYEILGFLARGGMGAVFKGLNKRTGKICALKVPSSHCLTDDDERRRFLREAGVARKLSHPNICGVLEVGQVADRPYLALEYIEGAPLRRWVARERPSLNDIALMMAKLAAAAHYANGQGVVHRDIKPENILVRLADGEPILLDFGLAHDELSDTMTTRTGLVAGTPAYMAPEYAFGLKANATTDVYSLGAVLYELLTGRPPYSGSPGDVLTGLRDGPPPTPGSVNPEIPDALDRVCQIAMARRAAARFATAQELADRLTEAVNGLSMDTVRLRAAQVSEMFEAEEPTADDEPAVEDPAAADGAFPTGIALAGAALAAAALVGWLLMR